MDVDLMRTSFKDMGLDARHSCLCSLPVSLRLCALACVRALDCVALGRPEQLELAAQLHVALGTVRPSAVPRSVLR